MAERRFNTGDLVQLKSGGPAMTVKDFNAEAKEGSYTCQWFNSGTLKEADFPTDSLAAAEAQNNVAALLEAVRVIKESREK